MPDLDINTLNKLFDEKAKERMGQIFKNPKLIEAINKGWNDPNTAKLKWKDMYRLGKQTSPANKDRQGYYSVVYLSNSNGEREPILVCDQIARGGKGSVKNAYNLKTGEHIALKIMRTTPDEEKVNDQEYKNEVLGLTFFKRVKGLQKRKETKKVAHYIGQDLIKGYDLATFINQQERKLNALGLRTHDEAFECYGSILQVMDLFLKQIAALHKEGFVLRDIKPSNAMFLEPPEVVLIDFGGMDKEPGARRNIGTGTAFYLAPELDRTAEKVPFTQKSDVYAAGIALQEIAGLFDNARLKTNLNIYNRKQDFPHSEIQRRLKGIIDDMMNPDPEARISMQKALENLESLLKSYGFEKILSPQKKAQEKKEEQAPSASSPPAGMNLNT